MRKENKDDNNYLHWSTEDTRRKYSLKLSFPREKDIKNKTQETVSNGQHVCIRK